MDLSDPRLTDLAFRVLPAAKEVARELGVGQPLGESEVVGAVSERIKQLEAGLAPELEFISAVNWLGQTPALNRIDQTPLPLCHSGSAELQAPDILCVASVNGRSLPLLIEVKRKFEPKLVMTEKYMSRLRRYADALKIPLLVAWKYGHIWTLTDIRHFEKKVSAYHLDFVKAMRENLMSLIFGDLLIQLTQRISFYLDAEVSNVPLPLPQPPNLMPPGDYSMTIQGAGFLLDGKPIQISNELHWLFLRSPDQNAVDVTGEKTVRVLLTAQEETMFSLTDLALMLLLWDEKDEDPDWEHVLRKPIPITAVNVRNELAKGIEVGVVQYVLEQTPQTMPDFIQALS